MLPRVNKKDAFVGFLVLVVLAGILYLVTKPKTKPISVPDIQETEESIESKFKIDIPDDIEKIELVDVTGGDKSGLATRSEVLADLPDPATGFRYQLWLGKGEDLVSVGELRAAKGGWLIEYNADSYPDYNRVIVSLEKVIDGQLEEKVLEGSF